MKHQKLERMTRGGLLLALTAILTAFVKVPLPVGYAHMGDGAVILSGLALGPFGALCAAVGSGLADLLSGFPIYIPFSVVIKGFMAFAAGKWMRAEDRLSKRNLLILALILLCVPVFYFPADWVYYGLQAAILDLPGNLGQAAVGYLVSALLLGGGVAGKGPRVD